MGNTWYNQPETSNKLCNIAKATVFLGNHFVYILYNIESIKFIGKVNGSAELNHTHTHTQALSILTKHVHILEQMFSAVLCIASF